MIDERRRRDDLYLCPSTLLPDTFSLDGAGFEEYVEASVDAGVPASPTGPSTRSC